MTVNNDAVNESLSALFDNEHSELDLRRVLKASELDENVNQKWAAYNVVHQSLKKEPVYTCGPSFLAGIQSAIADEATPSVTVKYNAWQRYAGKAAVAACVTFAFLIGANQWNVGGGNTEPTDIADTATSPRHESVAVAPSGFELPPLTARTVSSVPGTEYGSQFNSSPVRKLPAASTRQDVVLSPEMQEQLNRLMLKHAETASANGGLGVIPLTRVGSVKNRSE